MADAAASEPIPFGLLTTVFTSQHLPKIFSGMDTHDAVRDFIAQISPFIRDVEIAKTWVAAALPDAYEGDSLDEIHKMLAGAIAKGFDKRQVSDDDKPAPFLDFVLDSVALFHDDQGRGIIQVRTAKGGKRCFAIGSNEASLWLRHQFFRIRDRALRSQELADLNATLHAIAQFERDRVITALRVGGSEKEMYIDLGHDDGTVVKIDASGWSLTLDCPVHFLRSPGFRALPVPKENGDINKLRCLLSLDEANWLRFLGFLINALRYAGPYMWLQIEGDQGSGKSLLAFTGKEAIDPNTLVKRKLGDDDRSLLIQAKNNWLPAYDNVSGMRAEISDALCTISTGGGISTRKLYTDDEEQVFNYCRPFLINGIVDVATRPDLLERSIPINLEEMPPDQRREESDMVAEFRAILPEVLGCLYSGIASALRLEASTVSPVQLRMADAARWITAAEPGLGLVPGSIVNAIANTQSETMGNRVRNDVVVTALATFTKEHPIEGTVGDIHDLLFNSRDRRFDRAFPRTPSHFSRALKRLRPAMAKIGIRVEFLGHTNQGTRVRIWQKGLENIPARQVGDDFKA